MGRLRKEKPKNRLKEEENEYIHVCERGEGEAGDRRADVDRRKWALGELHLKGAAFLLKTYLH